MITRRRFMSGSLQLAGGITFSVCLPDAQGKLSSHTTSSTLEPNIYLKIFPDNQVHFWVKKAEMGQQVHTALTQMAMDELGVNLEQVHLHMASTEGPFKNISTGASWSIPGHWQPLRQMMANARHLLQLSAAQLWQCPVEDCTAQLGLILNKKTQQQITFGQLVPVAQQLPIPDKAPLKPAAEFQYIGKKMGRLDNPLIVQGKALYTGDIQLPDMLFASIIHPPAPGCKIVTIDNSQLQTQRALKNKVRVLQIEQSIAIVSEHQWPTLAAKNLIRVEWQHRTTPLNDRLLLQKMEDALSKPGIICREEKSATPYKITQTFTADYHLPFAAHVPMEPPIAIANITKQKAEIWAPTQTASEAQNNIAEMLNLPAEKVVVHTMLIGGGFGRKLKNDYVMDAARISQRLNRPVKLQWSRENDVQNGFFRPYGQDKVHASLSEDGYPVELRIKAASPSIMAKKDHQYFKQGLDWSAVMGLRSIPYDIPNMTLSHQLIDLPEVNLVAWRGTFANHHCFTIESLMDELAHKANIDPVDYRLQLLRKDTRVEHFLNSDIEIEHTKLRRVLLKAAEMMQWRSRKQQKKKNTGFGIACHCYDTHAYAAHVIEVEVDNKQLKIKKVACAFDVGIAVNPDGVKAQLEGSIVFGLSSALYNKIHFENGAVKESNFHDHPVLRHHEMPDIDIHIFNDGETPAGVGECGLPSVTPALTNAIFDACGVRVRSLPIKLT